jgi:hypothetical protein
MMTIYSVLFSLNGVASCVFFMDSAPIFDVYANTNIVLLSAHGACGSHWHDRNARI